MTSVVIPYLHAKNGLELKFCLRSIEKHLKGYGDIWIIGDAPNWINKESVKWLSVKDNPYPRNKEWNIYRKIETACQTEEISENFIMIHDDHIIMRDYEAETFPYYYHRTLYEGMQQNKGTYRATLNHSRTLLESKGLETKDFDCHSPIVYNKQKFISTFEDVKWLDWGYAIKSLYANTLKIEGEKTTDCKITSNKSTIIKKQAEGRDWFSTGTANTEMEIFLTSLYPRKSKYEN